MLGRAKALLPRRPDGQIQSSNWPPRRSLTKSTVCYNKPGDKIDVNK